MEIRWEFKYNHFRAFGARNANKKLLDSAI